MRPKIYLFGDSITEESFGDVGWGSSLANHFSRTADVVLRGYSGYNTRCVLKVKDKVFPAADTGDAPVAVTVFFGANDACLPDRCLGFLHVPLHEYKRNLLSILALLKKKWPSTHLILITPPPIDEAARLLTNEVTGGYAKQCLAAAAEYGIPAINLWEKMQEFPGWQKAYLRDGLHIAEDGNKVVFEEVIERLRELGISLETLPADLPLQAEIVLNEPFESFVN